MARCQSRKGLTSEESTSPDGHHFRPSARAASLKHEVAAVWDQLVIISLLRAAVFARRGVAQDDEPDQKEPGESEEDVVHGEFFN